MKYSQQLLQTFRLRNFKAVRDSGVVKFSPLTVFVGNNGVGKSSLIEGLETFQTIVTEGLDEAMNRWRGFEFVWNKRNAEEAWAKEQKKRLGGRNRAEVDATHPITFEIPIGKSKFRMQVGIDPEYEDLCILQEQMTFSPRIRKGKNGVKVVARTDTRDKNGDVTHSPTDDFGEGPSFEAQTSILIQGYPDDKTEDWVFLSLDPNAIAEPQLGIRSRFSNLRLNKTGSNIASYLQDLFIRSPQAFDDIVQTMRYVIPYAEDVNLPVASEIGRHTYLELTEGHFKVPGWLLSTGTLRVLALLAVLRHPNPPPLLFIEEIENGLDPRTLNLLVDEIQRAIQSGRTQVVCTTHSPYFLDLVPLSSIIVVERDNTGQSTFTRPDEKSLSRFKESFSPGQLYTAGLLTPKASEVQP